MTISSVDVRAFVVPTDRPEADGTLAWDATTVIVVEVSDGDDRGLGWTYASEGAVEVIRHQLAPVVIGGDASEIPRLGLEMAQACRNVGREGVAACAISAVDIALWDLRARQLGIALVELFGRVRDSVPIYGSGGFTTYDDETTAAQLSKWVDDWSIPRVKIKIGELRGGEIDRDLARIALARHVIGDAELFVDANGGYETKQAIRLAGVFADEFDVVWFEEPVSSDDLEGLRRVRDMFDGDLAAGEYGYTLDYFAKMLEAHAVDCLQADVTRCGGYTVWREIANLAGAHHLDLSGHCAPNLHAHVATSIVNLRHVEYFHDHHLIENMLFEGALTPDGGVLTPDLSRAGHGLKLRASAEMYRSA